MFEKFNSEDLKNIIEIINFMRRQEWILNQYLNQEK